MKQAPTLAQVTARLDEVLRVIADLKQASEIQFTRIAQLQAQVDVLPNMQRRGESPRSRKPAPVSNGNGHRS